MKISARIADKSLGRVRRWLNLRLLRRVPIVGLMRFSVITSKDRSSFLATRRMTNQDATKIILAPERLDHRLALLAAITLPSLDAQLDKNFSLGLLYSTLLDEIYVRRLEKLAEGRKYLKLVAVDPSENIADVARRLLPPPGPIRVSFRIDDDDAINPRHVANLRLAAVKENIGKVVTAPRGVYMQADGADLRIRNVNYATNAFGLGYVDVENRSIFDVGSHMRILNLPHTLLPEKRSWIRSLHGGCDTSHKLVGSASQRVPVAKAAQALREFSFLDFATVHRCLSGQDTETPAATPQ